MSKKPGRSRAAQPKARPPASSLGAKMSDVAKLAGVSAMTVSRALRNPDVVTAATLKRIRSAIKSAGYIPNRAAGALASSRSNIVGLIVPSLRNSLFVETIQGVADGLGKDFDLILADSGYTLKGEEAAVEAFLSQRACGIVLHNTAHTPRTRKLILEAGIPCVETGNLVEKPLDMSVGFSNYGAGYAMTDYLIGKGYRKIGFVSLPLKDNDRASERRRGHIAALKAKKQLVDPSLMLEAAPGLKSGGDALVALMKRHDDLDAIFLTGDVLATGAILEAARRGWKIPDKIAIAGSDDNELQECVIPPLTTVRFPRYRIGQNASRMLLDRILKRSQGPVVVDLGFEVMVRGSA